MTTPPPGLPTRALAAAAAALALAILGLLSLTVVFGAASAGCRADPAAALNGRVPKRLAPIYAQAAAAYGLGRRGPSILAAINWVETGFGTNLGVSSAEAEGWMQFLPSTWATYGVDGDGDGARDPYDPWDAIFAAARLLRASGAQRSWEVAIYSYNHAGWYVAKVERAARRFRTEAGESSEAEALACASVSSSAMLKTAIKVFSPRVFKALPDDLWAGGGTPESVDARIWPDAVWLLHTFDLQATAAREAGHNTHGDGTAMDIVPAPGRGWKATALRAAEALGWIPSCAASGSAPNCPLVTAIQFIGYNGYPGHGDPAHAGANAHLHVSWKSSDYGCPGLCTPREWVEVFP